MDSEEEKEKMINPRIQCFVRLRQKRCQQTEFEMSDLACRGNVQPRRRGTST